MNVQTGQPVGATSRWSGDVWGGLAAMLVALPSSVAFGIVVYAALGREHVAQGALAGILGAAALGLIAPLFGRTSGLISAPCAPAAAVLSALVMELLADGPGNGIEPETIPAFLALTALCAAMLQVLYGAAGGGKLIKFIPYPVVSGYLTGVGALIALGQLPKLLGLPKGTPLFLGLISPNLWVWQGLVVGLVTIVVMGLAPRFTTKAPAAILGLLGGLVAYFALAAFSPELLTIHDNPLVIGPIETSGSFLHAVAGRASSLLTVDLHSIRHILFPALTLSVLLSIDTLKTCVVLDALTHNRHNSNRELIGQGLGNLASFWAGGMPGAGTMGPTLVNVMSGGRTPRSGVIEGVCVVLVLLFLGRFVAWLPIGALAGILLVIAWRMFDKSMFRLLRYPGGRLDFAVIAGVIVVAVTIDLIAASGVGVVLAILLFIRDQMRGSVIRRKRYLNQVSSMTPRAERERELLGKYGDQGVFCELQGNLFFGTTDQLFSQMEHDLREKRYILFDMRRVQSMDFTAAHLLEQMHARLEARGGRLLFSGMPSHVLDQRDFEHDLVRVGAIRNDGGAMISETLNGALEWIEDRILEETGLSAADEEDLLDLNEIDLFRGFDAETRARLAGCVEQRSVPPGRNVFSRGDEADELFLIRRGCVHVLLPLEGGKRHHLATFGRGDFFGELSFLDRGARSADAEAKAPTDLFVLSRKRFDAFASASDPALAAEIFARLALAVAKRLRHTDAELAALEER